MDSRSLKILLFFFIALSAIGLVLSLIVHTSALLRQDLGFGQEVFILHVGIFIIWLPAILVLRKTTMDFKQREFWKAALRGCPAWMQKMTYGFGIYAILNFIIFFFFTKGHPINNTAEPSSVVIRGFSGHWMAFYSAALAVLYSATKTQETDNSRKCLNGHKVSPLANFCEECGSPVQQRS